MACGALLSFFCSLPAVPATPSTEECRSVSRIGPIPRSSRASGSAVRDRPDGAAGLWAAVPGLPRPERAEIVNLESGDKVTVALFRTGGSTIRVSREAADVLGIGDSPVTVQITALRSVPEIEY